MRERSAYTIFFNSASVDQQALLRSQQGSNASSILTVLPTQPHSRFSAAEFQILLRRRLRLPLLLGPATCRCTGALDALGDHRAACAVSGVLRTRAISLEIAAARVCREAGARVATNIMLRDLNVQGIAASDQRQIEVIANGLPLWSGAQIALDTTMVSPLTGRGQPHPRTSSENGCQLTLARQRKERKYPELLANGRCKLVVLAIEVGGRWSPEAASFISSLAEAKSRETPENIRNSVRAAWQYRWSSMISCAAQKALAASLLEETLMNAQNIDGATTHFQEVWEDSSHLD